MKTIRTALENHGKGREILIIAVDKRVDNVEKQMYKMPDFVLKTQKTDILFFGKVNEIYNIDRKAHKK